MVSQESWFDSTKMILFACLPNAIPITPDPAQISRRIVFSFMFSCFEIFSNIYEALKGWTWKNPPIGILNYELRILSII